MSIRQMTEVWKHSQHKGSELLLLLAIADHASDDGTGAYPGIKTLAEKTRMSERNVRRLVQKCEETGELEVSRRTSQYGTNEYILHIGQDKLSPPDMGGDKDGQDNGVLSRQDIAMSSKPSVKPSDSVTKVTEQSSAFYDVAEIIYNIKGKNFPDGVRQWVGRAYQAVKEVKLDVNRHDIQEFKEWYNKNFEGAAVPKDPAKLQMHFMAYTSSPELDPRRIRETDDEWRRRMFGD